MEHVAYYRVSTDKQGLSGLGMDAQRDAVRRWLAGRPVLAEYVEVESGRKSDRPQLGAALEVCRKRRATLVIAKLDRLARNVHFISGLMESGIEFVACDMPQANRLTIHILAAVAEHEREMISKRTKAALQQAKARGMRLGNPRPMEALEKANAAARASRPAAEVVALCVAWRKQGWTLRRIAAELNGLKLRTARGRPWHPMTARNLLAGAE